MAVNFGFVSNVLSLKWKSNPGWLPRILKYDNNADTGQRELLVLPMWIDMPWRKGSVFEAFIFT